MWFSRFHFLLSFFFFFCRKRKIQTLLQFSQSWPGMATLAGVHREPEQVQVDREAGVCPKALGGPYCPVAEAGGHRSGSQLPHLCRPVGKEAVREAWEGKA
jgi:hypothetical protein